MELGTTKELDTVGEDAFDCAGSLQSMISFLPTRLAKTSFTAVMKSQSAIKSFLRFVSTMTPPQCCSHHCPTLAALALFLLFGLPASLFALCGIIESIGFRRLMT